MLRSREKITPEIGKKLEKSKELKESEAGKFKKEKSSYINKFIGEQEYPNYSKRVGITPENHQKKFDEILEHYDISITSDEMYSRGNFKIKKEIGDSVKKILEENAKGKSLDELRKKLYGIYVGEQKALPDKEKDKKSEYKGKYLAYLVQKNIKKYEIKDFLKYKSPLRGVTERLANTAIFRELEKLKIPYGKPKQITEELNKERKEDGKKVLEIVKLIKKEISI
jgi:hypothetical protein